MNLFLTVPKDNTLKLVTLIKRVLRAYGWKISRYNIYNSHEVMLQAILDHFKIKAVIDAGANEGQYASQLVEHGYKGNIYSFEPIPSVYAILAKQASKSPQWFTFNMGVGRDNDTMLINVSENFVSSSLLKVNKTSVAAEPTSRTTHQEKISITSIDSFFSKQAGLEKEILLKLDIQGFEMEALHGALKSLPQIAVIQIELSYVPVYEGAPLYNEVVDFLSVQGFELYSSIPVFFDATNGRMLQADGIFVRKNS